MKDPDERIIKMRFTVKGMTDAVMTFVYSLSSGIYFIPQLAYNFGAMAVAAFYYNGANGRFPRHGRWDVG